MKNSMKVLFVSFALVCLLASCKKDAGNIQTVVHPQIFVAYANVVNGKSVVPSAANPWPLDSSSMVSGNYKATLNFEINNIDSLGSMSFTWYNSDANQNLKTPIESIKFSSGSIIHITPTVILSPIQGLNHYNENNLSINQYFGTLSIPVSKYIIKSGQYGLQGFAVSAKGVSTALPTIFVQIN